jgi:hypothetical protein
MTTRTRYFMIGSTLIVALGIGTGLVAFYNGELPMLSSRVGPAELTYVPADATGLAYANVHEVMNSEFRQRIRQILPTGESKDQLFNETGIDIEHDIDSVVAASLPGETPSHAVFLVRGRFDEGRIESLVRQHQGTVEEYKGHRLLKPGAGEGGANGPCVTFLETGLAALGDAASVKQAIDAAESHENVTKNSDLMTYVVQLDGSQNSAWAVGSFDALQKHANLPDQVKANLPAVQWFAVSAHVDAGVNGHVRAEARDDKSAQDLRAVVTGAVAAARLVSGKDAKLDALVNSLQIGGTGKNIELGFAVSPEMLDMITGVGAQGLKQLQDAGKQHAPEAPHDPDKK